MFSALPVNVKKSGFFQVILMKVNFSIDTLKQPLTLNATFSVLWIVTLLISIVFLMCSICSHLSLLVWNMKPPFSTTESFTWIDTFPYPDVSVKLMVWHGLLIILSEIESHNWKPDILPTSNSFGRGSYTSGKIVKIFTSKLTDLMSKVKISGATTYWEILKA